MLPVPTLCTLPRPMSGMLRKEPMVPPLRMLPVGEGERKGVGTGDVPMMSLPRGMLCPLVLLM